MLKLANTALQSRSISFKVVVVVVVVVSVVMLCVQYTKKETKYKLESYYYLRKNVL